MIPHLSVGENLLLGDAPEGPLGFVKWNQLFERAQQILNNLNLSLDVHEAVADLSPAERVGHKRAGECA